jgi:hypothetical protein
MFDPRQIDYSTRFVPTGPLPDREIDPEHVADVPTQPPAAVLHLAAGATETACGKSRAALQVTEQRTVFESARAGRLAAYPEVSDACFAQIEGARSGAYRSRG